MASDAMKAAERLAEELINDAPSCEYVGTEQCPHGHYGEACKHCGVRMGVDDSYCVKLAADKIHEELAATIERCAQIADAAKYEDTTGCDVACGFNGACDEIGAAIRAMKGAD